jgi:DNA (cytosine-5)-methyltransferase 1
MIRYGSVCSGIEAATAAWHGLGWKPSFFSEIEAFPRAVLQHHYPDVPLHGDFTTIKGDEYEPINLLVGGTPCQSFSIAGLRGGLDDDRGNLALEFLRLAQRTRPKWLVWENVPGVLSSNGGRDFGSIIGGMVEIGYGIAYRVLDAQYFGVAQRRRRVFVVGCLGNAASAAAVLFERHSLQGHPAPRREKREGIACFTPSSIGGYSEGVGTLRANGGDIGGGSENIISNSRSTWPVEVAPTLNASFGSRQGLENQHALGGAGWFVPSVVGALTARGLCGTGMRETVDAQQYIPIEASLTLSTVHDQNVQQGSAVRRLTPRECERLQGFSDDFTQIPYRNKPADQCPDGPRYKALGNSMAVPVMRWIGERIEIVESINRDRDRQ